MQTKPCLLSLLLAAAMTPAQAAVRLHVATNGNDANPGSAAAPFRTLVRARDALRALRKGNAGKPLEGGAEILLHAGTYRLTAPLELGPADSGAPGAPVVYRDAGDGAVRLSGGLPLALPRFAPVTDSTVRRHLPAAGRDRVLACRLEAKEAALLGPPWPDTWFIGRRFHVLNELFAGSMRLPLARWPNTGYAVFGPIVEAANSPDKTPAFTCRDQRFKRWDPNAGVWLYGYWRRGYRAEFIRVKSIDRQTGILQLAARNTLGPLEDGGGCRFFAVNLLEELDAPGEWYLDRKTRTLYLIPPSGEITGGFELSVNPEAIIHGNNASHIEFRNLLVDISARDGIRIEGGTDCRIVRCEIRNVAFTGVAITGDRHRIIGCDIHDTGNSGIEIRTGDRYKLIAGGAVVDNCHIHHTNRIVRAGSRAVSIRGVGARFSHNLIHDCGYIAVAFQGNDHVMEYNRLFRTNTEAVEGGVFYTGRDWTSRGSVIRYNFVHQIEDSREGCGSATRFVHLDDSAPEVDVYGNVCYRLGGGVSICGGAANRVHDNLFVECHWGVDIGPRGEDMFVSDGKGGFRVATMSHGWTSLVKLLRRYHWNQPPYSTRYPLLVNIFRQTPIAAPWFNVVERNLMVDCAYGIRKNAMRPEWSTIRDNWEGSDPGFVQSDRSRLDFRLRPDAPVLREVGFQSPPMEKIGLYPSPDRRSWPVPLDLPPKDWKPRWMRLRDQAANALGALPFYKIARVTGRIVVDGTPKPMEWTPGDATGHAPDVHHVLELKWTPAGKPAKRPATAMVQTDNEALYVRFQVDIDPAKGITGGHHWGRDDAVEVALAEQGDKLGPILVLRGYADGTWETTEESGAPAAALSRLRHGGVEYAAARAGKGQWTAEWRIPFRALGIDPRKQNRLLLFNLSVRNVGDDEWVMLKSSGDRTWELRRSCVLWLSPFGEAVMPNLEPSTLFIHILSTDKTADMLEPVRGCAVCSWAKPSGYRISARLNNPPVDAWTRLEFSFRPRVSGKVQLILLGEAYTDPRTKKRQPVWVYVDDIRVQGASFRNGSFEQRRADGTPEAWQPHVKPGISIHDPKLAAEGAWLVKVAFDRRFAQPFDVRAGQLVTVSARVRGLPVRRSSSAP